MTHGRMSECSYAGYLSQGNAMADPNEVDERLRARQMRAEEMQQDNAESLDRSLQIVSEMEEVGRDTLEKLNEQGEQLNRISEDVDKTDENLTTAKYILKKIKAPFTAMFVRKPKKKEKTPLESPGIPPPKQIHGASEKGERRRSSRSLKEASYDSDSKVCVHFYLNSLPEHEKACHAKAQPSLCGYETIFFVVFFFLVVVSACQRICRES